MKLTKEDIKTAYILTLFISGVITSILGKTLIKNELLFFSGLGLLSSSMAISIFETFKRKD